MIKFYNTIVRDKHHNFVCVMRAKTIEEAIDFMQKANDDYKQAHFFAIDEVEQYEDGCLPIRRIIDDAVYVGTTN